MVSQESELEQGPPKAKWWKTEFYRESRWSKEAYIIIALLGIIGGSIFLTTGVTMAVYTSRVCPGKDCTDLPDWWTWIPKALDGFFLMIGAVLLFVAAFRPDRKLVIGWLVMNVLGFLSTCIFVSLELYLNSNSPILAMAGSLVLQFPIRIVVMFLIIAAPLPKTKVVPTGTPMSSV